MKRMTLAAPSGKCDILIGEKLANVAKYAKGEKVVVVTDSNVRKLYGAKFPLCEVIEIGTGEKNKTLATVEKIYGRFLELELERSSFVIGIGGGIVTDVTGYAATNYVRGMGFGFVATTLLAQVDAAIGGKNGVNFKGYKNIIGTVRQPSFCICDPEVLGSLPPREVRNGLAEAIKTAAIADASLFDYLEKNMGAALKLDGAAMENIVAGCVTVKAGIVSRDESEHGERMLLNFGHTLGHALEKTTRMPHGEAVAIGMARAAELSVAKGMLAKGEAERLLALIKAAGLPTDAEMERNGIVDAIRKDKKRAGGKIRMVLLERLGKAKICEVEIDELAALR